jgi:phospholipase A1
VRYSSGPNQQPYPVGSDPAASPFLDLQNIEAKFQLSFKLKVVSGLLGEGSLWFAYTQQSQWQVYNADISRPFRETNYEPEVMLAFPTNYDLLGLKGRLLNFGFVHQSNGQSEPLSRSWNRAYVQVGLERGNFAVLVRPWYRIPETPDTDDNPQITDYIGRGDLVATYRLGGHQLSLLVRNNLSIDDNRGALQLDWSFPLYGQLKGYLQLFCGYGESLIDYNYKQNTVGVGVLLYDWL